MNNSNMTIIEADTMQKYIVAKDNQFIKKSLYDLSLMEQRILACAIATLDSRQELRENEVPVCRMRLSSFCELCGIEKRGAVKYLKGVLKKLHDTSYWIQREDGSYKLFSWLTDADIIDKEDMIIVRLSLHLKPFLLNLNSDFTEFKLPMILRFTNKFSNMIFDLIYAEYKKTGYIYGVERKYSSGTLKMSVEDMKLRVRVKKGQDEKLVHNNIKFVDLRIHMLEPAIKDINKFTDIIVDIEYIMNGRKTEYILFHYRPKTKAELSKVPLFRGKRIESL